MERVVASLMERYRGRLPLWLAPVQAVVLPVSEAQDEARPTRLPGYCGDMGFGSRCAARGVWASRIREARTVRASVVVVIGEREAAQAMVQATDGRDGIERTLAVNDLAERMQQAHRDRVDLVW